MAPRRWLLLALSLGSLVVLVYAGISFALSVPVTGEMEAQSRIPGAEQPAAGQRAVVVPLVDPTIVETARGGADGAILVVSDRQGALPSNAENASIVRALAFVEGPPESGNDTTGDGNATTHVLVFAQVPGPGENGTLTNFTVDLSALNITSAGYVVKSDANATARFVPTSQIVGEVARYETTASAVLLFASGAFGFVAPLVMMVLTHKAAGRGGNGGGVDAFCRECRAPLDVGADFCTRCGAYRER